MKTAEIRQKLHDYIRVADTKKVKAIYTIVEEEIEAENEIWTEDFLKELNKRSKEFETGKVRGYSWDEVKKRAKRSRKHKRK